ncbi:facilitated trehalose transporter Tret1-like isoform X2 [Pararge aegeria]|nr:facilitated trehalose transporter Tret1-like isoform X2 [Pararge aegeria]
MDDPTTTLDAEAGASHTELDNKNGHSLHSKVLKRLETVPDIKRDTSGITTQYIATGIVNLGAFATGVCVAWSSSALPLYLTNTTILEEDFQAFNGTHSKIGVTPRGSWVVSLLCLGALFGAVPSGLISEHFGRKKTLLYLALPLLVSWILVASSPNVYGLYVGRFVGGVAVGAFSVSVPPYVEDIAESHLLPALANFYHVLFACGLLFGYIIGMVQNLSWLAVLCVTIPVAFFIAFIFLPESPAYLLSQGKSSEAKSALRYFRGIDNDVDGELKAIRETLRNFAKNRVTFKQLFTTKATVKALVVSFGLMIFQQLSGIYPVLFYSEMIFCSFANPLYDREATYIPSIILGFCLVSSTYFSTMFLKRMRRRVLLLCSFTGMALSLGSLAIYYQLKASNLSTSKTWIPVLALCIFVSVYAAGAGPIPWLMLREIFPPNVRRRATAITAGFHWFLAFGVTKLYQNLEKMVQAGWVLWNFAVICVIGTIFIYFFVPETKGRTLEEIQNELNGIHKRRAHRHVIQVETIAVASS